ncbi:MAG: Ppx/GppA phosphatase family protein [Nitrospinaceae bacterium]|nr:Ppx/GppA phosphatase family protein [Nitrospinaceae bacterium]
MTRVASIDIGSNAVRLLILEKTPDGGLRELDQERVITRLGKGMDTEKNLLSDRMDETLSVLTKFRDECLKFEPLTIRTVATSAVREAGNQKDFVSRAKKEIGLRVEVISWEEEANLMVKGALWKLPNVEKNVLAFDIGGGSTEFVLAKRREIFSAVGTNLGAVRLAEKFITHNPVDVNEYKALEAHLRGELKLVKEKFADFSYSVLLGAAGTVTTLAAIDEDIYPYDSDKIHGKNLTFKRIEELLGDLKKKSLVELAAMNTLEKGREDLIIVGGALALETMRVFECNLMIVSDHGLLEGIVLDILN